MVNRHLSDWTMASSGMRAGQGLLLPSGFQNLKSFLCWGGFLDCLATFVEVLFLPPQRKSQIFVLHGKIRGRPWDVKPR